MDDSKNNSLESSIPEFQHPQLKGPIHSTGKADNKDLNLLRSANEVAMADYHSPPLTENTNKYKRTERLDQETPTRPAAANASGNDIVAVLSPKRSTPSVDEREAVVAGTTEELDGNETLEYKIESEPEFQSELESQDEPESPSTLTKASLRKQVQTPVLTPKKDLKRKSPADEPQNDNLSQSDAQGTVTPNRHQDPIPVSPQYLGIAQLYGMGPEIQDSSSPSTRTNAAKRRRSMNSSVVLEQVPFPEMHPSGQALQRPSVDSSAFENATASSPPPPAAPTSSEASATTTTGDMSSDWELQAILPMHGVQDPAARAAIHKLFVQNLKLRKMLAAQTKHLNLVTGALTEYVERVQVLERKTRTGNWWKNPVSLSSSAPSSEYGADAISTDTELRTKSGKNAKLKVDVDKEELGLLGEQLELDSENLEQQDVADLDTWSSPSKKTTPKRVPMASLPITQFYSSSPTKRTKQ